MLGDYDAMFDGVRDLLVNADIAVAPLEHPLTANQELTPCVETVDLQPAAIEQSPRWPTPGSTSSSPSATT